MSEAQKNIKANCQNNLPPSGGVERSVRSGCSHWSLHIGDIGQGGPFEVPASGVTTVRCLTHTVFTPRGRGLEAEAKKQFWTRIVTGSAPPQ